jgi:hypothetical protein
MEVVRDELLLVCPVQKALGVKRPWVIRPEEIKRRISILYVGVERDAVNFLEYILWDDH